MQLVHPRPTGPTTDRSDGGDVYETRMASTDPSPFAVARRHVEAATGVAMRDWTGRYAWARAWHHDLTLIEAGQRGVLPATLGAALEHARQNEAARLRRGRRFGR
jgi:hypothetical protein